MSLSSLRYACVTAAVIAASSLAFGAQAQSSFQTVPVWGTANADAHGQGPDAAAPADLKTNLANTGQRVADFGNLKAAMTLASDAGTLKIPGVSPQTLAAQSALIQPGQAATNAGMAAAASAPAQARAVLALLTPSDQPATPATYGLAAGLGVQPAVPDLAALDHETAVAVVAAFQKPAATAADQAASNAADTVAAPGATPPTPGLAPSNDPALDERVDLARTVFRVDGTDELIRHFVATTHMRLIIGEVANHIDIAKLSEADKYRLSAIASSAQTELGDKVLNLMATLEAKNLSKPELMQLVVAFNIDPVRKLTNMRLHDDGKLDKATELDVTMSQYQIVKSFEAGQ